VPQAILPPHGAYKFTGDLMGKAYGSLMASSPEWILLMAPVHGDDTEGLFLPDGEVFETPLGDVSLAADQIKLLIEANAASVKDSPFKEEPALELQLPFIKRLFPEAKVLPLYVGGKRRRVEKSVTSALKKISSAPLTIITTNVSDFEQRRLNENKAKGFIQAVESENFNPREYEGVANYKPCGQTILNGYWDFLGKKAKMSLIDWGSDNKEAEPGDKCSFYGAFRIDKD